MIVVEFMVLGLSAKLIRGEAKVLPKGTGEGFVRAVAGVESDRE